MKMDRYFCGQCPLVICYGYRSETVVCHSVTEEPVIMSIPFCSRSAERALSA